MWCFCGKVLHLFSPLFFLLLTPSENAKKKQMYLLSPDDFRAENAHEEHTHTHIHTCTNFQEHFDRETEDMCARVLTKLSYFSCFFVCIFSLRKEKNKCSLQKSARIYTMTERKSSRKTLTPKRFIPEETEKKDKDLSGGQKSGGSKVSLIS